MKTIGIVAHGAEGGALCFITACREGQKLLGPHMHPEIVVSAVPMALSIPGWNAGDHAAVAEVLRRSVDQVVALGADFFICPNNTAHIALELVAETLPIPALHIADVVCSEMNAGGWRRAGLLGTKLTMNGPVYATALQELGFEQVIPSAERQEQIDRAIFDELCQGNFPAATTEMFVAAIRELADAGADCVILGCTEIPLIINEANSPLPFLDSTRLLARHAVNLAVSDEPLINAGGWLNDPHKTADIRE